MKFTDMFEEICGIQVRANNAYDKGISLEVIGLNKYRLPTKLLPTDIILDIGAHVGSFSFACLQRGAGKVYAFEPDEANFLICTENLKRFGSRAVPRRAAIWRSDKWETELLYTGPSQTPLGINHGGGNILFEDGDGIPVPVEALDSILSNIRHVRLMKLDCEGSEWPVLFTSRFLECVDEIIGEYHEIGGKRNNASIPPKALLPGYSAYTREDLVSFLDRHGFSVEIAGSPQSHIGAFFAKRPELHPFA